MKPRSPRSHSSAARKPRSLMDRWSCTSRNQLTRGDSWLIGISTSEENPGQPASSSIGRGQYNAITARRLVIRLSSARMPRDAQSAPQKAIATVATTRRFRSAFYAGALTNRSAGIVRSSTRHAMNKTLRVMQLNVRK